MRGLRGILSAGAAIMALTIAMPLASAGDLTLEVSGDCPGRLTLRWSGAEPSRPMALFFSRELGAFRLPGSYCGGTYLGLGSSGLRVVGILRSGSEGSGSVSGQSGDPECGRYLQLLLVGSPGMPCVTSNVVQIPE